MRSELRCIVMQFIQLINDYTPFTEVVKAKEVKLLTTAFMIYY